MKPNKSIQNLKVLAEKQGHLHLHTPHSDGQITLMDIINSDQDFVAISDHDTTAGFESYSALEKLGIEVIPAIELSCFFYGKKLHVLSYWPDTQNQVFQEKLAEFRDRRYVRTLNQVKHLQNHGFDICIDYFPSNGIIVKNMIAETVLAQDRNKTILAEQGISSKSEFIKEYLSFGRPTYLALKRTPAEEILPFAGGVLVLAHPGRNLDVGKDDFIIEQLVSQFNLKGIEVISRQDTDEENLHYSNLAKKLNLIPTISNDVHYAHQLNDNLSNYETVELLRSAYESSKTTSQTQHGSQHLSGEILRRA